MSPGTIMKYGKNRAGGSSGALSFSPRPIVLTQWHTEIHSLISMCRILLMCVLYTLQTTWVLRSSNSSPFSSQEKRWLWIGQRPGTRCGLFTVVQCFFGTAVYACDMIRLPATEKRRNMALQLGSKLKYWRTRWMDILVDWKDRSCFRLANICLSKSSWDWS